MAVQPLDVVLRLLGDELDALEDVGDVIDLALGCPMIWQFLSICCLSPGYPKEMPH